MKVEPVLESALWEATRPAFKVRYVHDTNGQRISRLYASYGAANGKTARAKLARIVRRAPEVFVKVTGRQKGGNHVKTHLNYIGRKGDVEIETRDGEILTSKEDVDERAAEWSDTLQWRSRPTISSVSLVFSMPAGTEPDKVLGAVRALAHAEFSDNHDYVMALHTDTPQPHVHLTVQAEGLDRSRFNPRPIQLNRLRERFARELRARGVVAEATPRRARGQGIAGSGMALVKLRARLRSGTGGQMTDADRRTNEQALAAARGQAALPAFIGAGKDRWEKICMAYRRAASALDATGLTEDRNLASDVRDFLGKHQGMNATPEIFAARYSRQLDLKLNRPAQPSHNRGRDR